MDCEDLTVVGLHDTGPMSAALEADALTTWPTRWFVLGSALGQAGSLRAMDKVKEKCTHTVVQSGGPCCSLLVEGPQLAPRHPGVKGQDGQSHVSHSHS